MTEKLFVHYPVFVSARLREEFDELIRAHQTLCFLVDRVDISSKEHVLRQVKGIEPLQSHRKMGSYIAYALLHVITRFSFPPSPGELGRRPLFREDLFKVRYHIRHLDECAYGIFVPLRSGKWPYDMWRNATRMIRQKKQLWQIREQDGKWRIIPLDISPLLSDRLNRVQTLDGIMEYIEPREYPSLYTIIRDAFKERK